MIFPVVTIENLNSHIALSLLVPVAAERGAKGRRAFAPSRLSAGLGLLGDMLLSCRLLGSALLVLTLIEKGAGFVVYNIPWCYTNSLLSVIKFKKEARCSNE